MIGAFHVNFGGVTEFLLGTQVDDKKIKSAGVAGVMKPGKNSVQVIIGTKVQFVADEFSKLCE